MAPREKTELLPHENIQLDKKAKGRKENRKRKKKENEDENENDAFTSKKCNAQ